MKIHFQCPNCKAKYWTVAENIGKSSNCKKCGTSLKIPDNQDAISNKLPTKWLNFYVYFYLPFAVIISFFPMLARYHKLMELGYKPELTPLTFVPMIFLDIFICFMIYGLHKRRYWAWIYNWMFLASGTLLSPINYLTSFSAYLVAATLMSLILFCPIISISKKEGLSLVELYRRVLRVCCLM